ncbi:MAG: TetR/AcrR family transcriptional regulator [Cyclobacteriaceae bacterium]|jgi:AcrR family transcriptional regulator|nr:TetR/AcrR family transcriptional regulator [Cyclobacteriaceae bacterium]
MKTRALIKETARSLFNHYGLMNVTLRQVAESLNKSYGNITYHYPTKEKLVEELYADMTEALKSLAVPDRPLLDFLLMLPEITFRISLDYLFFFADYVELKRHYRTLMKRVDKDNRHRMQVWKGMLLKLQADGLLRADLDDTALDYLMELSGAVRTFYFQQHSPVNLSKKAYTAYVNQLLLPYLSAEGLTVYKQHRTSA